MPRQSKGPRLWLRPERNRGARGVESAVWLIRDDGKEFSTRCGECDRLGAEAALFTYIKNCSPSAKLGTYIYFLTAKAEGFPIKIGITTNRFSRFSAIQTSLPYELDIIGFWPIRDQSVERALHSKFDRFRLRGEWFQRSDELLAFIDALELQPPGRPPDLGPVLLTSPPSSKAA